MITSGVYPVFDNVFKINISDSTTKNMVTIADCTDFSVAMDNNIEEWTPMEQGGWVRRLQTGKSISISLNAKRNVGDPGNDYCAECAFKTGQDTYTDFEWEMPNGDKIEFHCVINVTALGGTSRDVESLQCEVLSDGAVVYTPKL